MYKRREVCKKKIYLARPDDIQLRGKNRTSAPAGSPSISFGKEQPKLLPTSKYYFIYTCTKVDLLALIPVALNLRFFLWKLKVATLASEMLSSVHPTGCSPRLSRTGKRRAWTDRNQPQDEMSLSFSSFIFFYFSSLKNRNMLFQQSHLDFLRLKQEYSIWIRSK